MKIRVAFLKSVRDYKAMMMCMCELCMSMICRAKLHRLSVLHTV